MTLKNLEASEAGINAAYSIAAAELRTGPFPHIAAENVFSPDELARIVANWPGSEDMYDEPGEQKRQWFLLIENGRNKSADVNSPDAGYWADFIETIAKPIFAAVFDKFAPYYSVKLGTDQTDLRILGLSCMESSEEFTIHEVHHHYDCGPDWAFTFLIYIDDGERIDRGTTLFSVPDLQSDEGYLDALTSMIPPTPATTVPFKAGSMLAFLDSPVSFHGSSLTGTQPGVAHGRKIIRCHAAIATADSRRLYKHKQINDDFAQACAAYRISKDPSVFEPFNPGFERDREMVRSFANPGPTTISLNAFELNQD
jgi:hypothetical protein